MWCVYVCVWHLKHIFIPGSTSVITKLKIAHVDINEELAKMIIVYSIMEYYKLSKRMRQICELTLRECPK